MKKYGISAQCVIVLRAPALSNVAVASKFEFTPPELKLVPPVRLKPPPDPIRKALLWSALGHVSIVLAFLLGPMLFDSTPTAAPLEIDVTYVELSAFETQLPKKQGPETQTTASVVQPPPPPAEEKEKPISLNPKKSKPEPKKLIEKPKPATESQQSAPIASDPSAAPSAKTIAGVANGVEGLEKARVSYQDMIATLLARAKRYPERAVRNRITGNGTLRLMIAPEGSVVKVEIVSSTQSPILDEELHRMVERASPFPAFPAGMTQSQVALLVPVAFRLEK